MWRVYTVLYIRHNCDCQLPFGRGRRDINSTCLCQNLGSTVQVLEWRIVQSVINPLRPSDAIWRNKCWRTLAQVMACCLSAPSHYFNQCWLIITMVYWHSSEGNSTTDTSASNHKNWIENYLSKISLKSLRGQWVKPDISSLPSNKVLNISVNLHQPFERSRLRKQEKSLHAASTVCMMTSSNGNRFRITDHLCGESTDFRWIPHPKANDAELWCFFFQYVPE